MPDPPSPLPQCHHARDRECRDDGLADHDGIGNGNAVQRGWSSSSIMSIRHASALVRHRDQSAGSSNATAHRKNASPDLMRASFVFETVVLMPIVTRSLALHHDNGFHLVKYRPDFETPEVFRFPDPKLTHGHGQESSSNTRLTTGEIYPGRLMPSVIRQCPLPLLFAFPVLVRVPKSPPQPGTSRGRGQVDAKLLLCLFVFAPPVSINDPGNRRQRSR